MTGADLDRLVSWYGRLGRRDRESITTLVLHATEIPHLDEAWEFAERSAKKSSDGTGVCGHLYIDREGTVHRFVPIDYIAAHAAGHNASSIGIELINKGRYPHHFDSRYQNPKEPFPESQIAALKRLMAAIVDVCPKLRTLLRHSDIDTNLVQASDDPEIRVRRRIDPGPQFPWSEVKEYWSTLVRDQSPS